MRTWRSFTVRLSAHVRFAACGGPIRLSGYQNWLKSLCLSRRKEGEVRLIIGIHTGHQLDIGAIAVGQAAVPCIAELVIAPRPLFLAGRDVVVGDVSEARLAR